LSVIELEAELPPPSYTWNSLAAWKSRHPEDEGMFIIGAEDFANLDTWRRGRELPELMDFAVMARADSGRDLFRATIARLWPDIKPPGAPAAKVEDDAAIMPGGTVCRFLVMPPLDVSASLIRTKWLRGQDISFLVPDAALSILRANRDLVTSLWRTDADTAEPRRTPRNLHHRHG
jgi:nicotinate-nucleotide adenylyltransferase